MHLNAPDGAISFLKTSVDPKQFKTVPPNMFNQTTFPKAVSVSGNWVIRADSAITGPVKDQDSIVLWQTQHGAADIRRFGIVPAGTSLPVTSTPPVWVGSSSSNVELVTGFTFDQELALPYSNESGLQVQISPDLSKDFSVVRTYAGMINLLSDSVPIGNTALTGRFAGGTINDIRDIQQTTTGAFPEAALQQQTVTAKDGIKGIGVSEGIVAILGPDLNPTFSAPTAWSTRYYGQADIEKIAFNGYNKLDNPPIPNNAWVLPFGSVFLSPIEGFNCVTPFRGDTYNLKMGQLPNASRVRIHSAFPPVAVYNGGAGRIMVNVSYYAVHYFAHVDANGMVVISNDVPPQNAFKAQFAANITVQPRAALHAGGSFLQEVEVGNNSTIPSCSVTFDVDLVSNDKTYVGSLVFALSCDIDPPGGAATSYYTYPTELPWTFNIEALDLYNSGQLGPTRVLRWDNVSPGQEMKLDGVLLAQCVPEGQIAPFVSPTAQMQQVALHLNVFPWMNAVYNGTGPLRRIWPGREYVRMVNLLRDTGVIDGTKIAPEDENAGQAAGLFANLGSYAGHSIGTMVDDAAHGIFGSLGLASGQFGSASGQFGGEAAGSYMYGDAAGGRRHHGHHTMSKRIRFDE